MDAEERTEAKEATSAATWKKQVSGNVVEVPSGNHAIIRRRSLNVFFKTGRIPNSLMPLVQKALTEGGTLAPKDEQWTNEQLKDLMVVMDMIVVECCVEPKVHAIPVCKNCEGKQSDVCDFCEGSGEGERDESLLYVDDVDFNDKSFIYNYALAGDIDLTSFRAEQEGDVESLPDSEDVEVSA